MIDLTIKELNKDLIHQANYNSFNGKRGDIANRDYIAYCNTVLGWKISDEKKRKLLDKIYEKRSEILKYEAQHVSVMVAGPAKYNSRKLDKGDKIMSLSAEFCEWFEGLERQLQQSESERTDLEQAIKMVQFCDERPELDPTGQLGKLATLDADAFVEWFEKLQPKYKWRKNSNLYKLYVAAKDGKLVIAKRETFFEDENLTAYRYGDRAYIKFVMKPQRQLMVALKSRGWWWNSYESAWSTYLEKVDEEWLSGISSQYAKYV